MPKKKRPCRAYAGSLFTQTGQGIRRFTTRWPRPIAVCPRRKDLAPMNTAILANAGHRYPEPSRLGWGIKNIQHTVRYTELAPDRFCSRRIHQMHTAARGALDEIL